MSHNVHLMERNSCDHLLVVLLSAVTSPKSEAVRMFPVMDDLKTHLADFHQRAIKDMLSCHIFHQYPCRMARHPGIISCLEYQSACLVI